MLTSCLVFPLESYNATKNINRQTVFCDLLHFFLHTLLINSYSPFEISSKVQLQFQHLEHNSSSHTTLTSVHATFIKERRRDRAPQSPHGCLLGTNFLFLSLCPLPALPSPLLHYPGLNLGSSSRWHRQHGFDGCPLEMLKNTGEKTKMKKADEEQLDWIKKWQRRMG